MENPKIRFKGFTKDWEQRKLGDVCSRVQGNDGRMKLPTLTISAGNGWMRQEDRFSGNIAGNEQKNYTLLHTGELSYNHGNSKLAKYGAVFSLRNYEEALVPRVYHSFRVEEGCADYIEYYFATKLPDRELRKLISSGARMDGLLNIGYDEFMGIKMMFPSIKEQNEIATYFRSLDHLITLHQRKCEQTKKLKKYMLQKMFPQNGAKVPEIRFDGFTYDWEQRKVTDLGEIYIGLVTTMTEHYTDKGHLLIRNSDIKDGYFEFGENPIYLDEEFSEQNKLRMHQLGDVITVHTGDIGTSAVIGENEVNSIGFATIVTRPNQEILDSNYFATYLNTDTHKQWAVSMATGDGRSNYNLKDYTKLVVPIPEIEEQKKIAACIVNLNSLITLHQRKCDELKKMKKYMLQNMFI